MSLCVIVFVQQSAARVSAELLLCGRHPVVMSCACFVSVVLAQLGCNMCVRSCVLVALRKHRLPSRHQCTCNAALSACSIADKAMPHAEILAQEVPATARSFTSLTQTEMQLALKAWLQRDEFAEAADSAQLDEWIASNLTDTQQRWAYVKQLVAHARSFAYKDTERMQTLGDMLSDSVK